MEYTFESLIQNGWLLSDKKESILGNLFNQKIDYYKIVPLTGRKNRYGATYFQLFLQNKNGVTSSQPVIIGLYNKGEYPAYNWIEIIRLSFQIDFKTDEKVYFHDSDNSLTQQLFNRLVDILPPGWHIMVEYDSPEHSDTARLLASGIPPIATPLGYTLFHAGCNAGFRDWYIAEGGVEGPRKIQGNKALDKEHAKGKAMEMANELKVFLKQPTSIRITPQEEKARQNALKILNYITQ